MEMDRIIRQAILPVVPICDPNTYEGEEQTYCVFDYSIIPWTYADGVPISFNYSTQVHLYLPIGKNPSSLIAGIMHALPASGLPVPEVTNASNDASQHYVFDFSHIVYEGEVSP